MVEKNDLIVCRCEEIYESEIIEAIKAGARSVTDVKRRTRAGMGLCQGKTCGKIVQRIISRELGIPLDQVELGKNRPPVRPITFGMLEGDNDE